MFENHTRDERSSDRFDGSETLTHELAEPRDNRKIRKRPGKTDHSRLRPIEVMLADGEPFVESVSESVAVKRVVNDGGSEIEVDTDAASIVQHDPDAASHYRCALKQLRQLQVAAQDDHREAALEILQNRF